MKHQTEIQDWQIGGFGLYIHWPFCQSKCPYCDFNSHVWAKVDQTRWLEAYLLEIDRLGAETSGRVLQSVFFGGGTPSLMDPEIVHMILQRISATWTVANDIEITLEANPTSVEAGRFRAYHSAGVNRVSIGVQALNDNDLKALGRLHSVDEAILAIRIAQSTFDRMSLDLIYARQNQSLESWRSELNEAIALSGDHLSLYQLTIEDGTAFGDRFKRGRLGGLPDEDLGADMYLDTQRITANAGFSSYEVSNYARNGAESRHNCIYWNAGDYVGIGPGAHGRLTLGSERYASEAISNPASWLNHIESGKSAEKRSRVSPSEQGTEYLMMGLRRDEGIDLRRFEAISGSALPIQKINQLHEIGMVIRQGNQLIVTQNGRLVLNSIIEKLMA